ncbi:hypothetical protein [Methanosarcina horonobensis]|nr:hypothetical protein [Methanosarcina horonobensis]
MIKSKLNSYLILNLVPLVVLTLLALRKDPSSLIPSLLLFLTISLYMVSVLIYLTGLSPSIYLYNGKTFAFYTFSVMPLLLLNIVLSMFGPYYAFVDLLLLPVALYLLLKGFTKWDRNESRCF